MRIDHQPPITGDAVAGRQSINWMRMPWSANSSPPCHRRNADSGVGQTREGSFRTDSGRTDSGLARSVCRTHSYVSERMGYIQMRYALIVLVRMLDYRCFLAGVPHACGGNVKATLHSSAPYVPSNRTDIRKTFARVRREAELRTKASQGAQANGPSVATENADESACLVGPNSMRLVDS
jgi:hypothetical protein